MVKVSIRDYMPPYTSWMQVELEDGVCDASVQNINNDEKGKIKNQDYTEELKNSFSNDAWSQDVNTNS